jgi:hypothetical protein
MMRAIRLVLAAAVALTGLVGCSLNETKWTGETATYVVYAKQIPLYPGAKARDAMGSESWGDTPDSYSEGMAVWFEVQGYDKEKVLAWYEEKLPNATTQVLDTGAIELTVPVPNGEPGEDMGVVIEDDGFRVFENTKAGKHKKS